MATVESYGGRNATVGWKPVSDTNDVA